MCLASESNMVLLLVVLILRNSWVHIGLLYSSNVLKLLLMSFLALVPF